MQHSSTDPQQINVDRSLLFQRRPSHRSRYYTFFVTFFLVLVLLSTIVGNLTIAVPHALAAQRPLPQPVKVTYKQFLNPKASSLQPFTFPQQKTALLPNELKKNPAQILPSAQPASMQPVHQVLSAAFLAAPTSTKNHNLAGTPSGGALQLQGNDGRVTVTIPAGALDSTHVTTTNHVSVASVIQQQGLSLTLTQQQGNSVGSVNLLGQYQFQFTDAQEHPLTNIRLRQPITITYHYQPQEIRNLGIDPGHLVLTWPEQIQQAIAAKQAITNMVVPMHNDPVSHTLTAQTTVLGTLADVGAGTPTDQSPPKPNEASVGGNSGQLSYAYPIQVAPGPNGTTPTVELAYSSAGTNERHYPTSPADSPGEGWGISMGSISMSTYPPGSSTSGTWYSLSGVDNVSDRLIPTSSGSTSYYTEHISHLKVTRVTQSNGQPCFKVWDTSGDYSEYGCTSDSLQYSTDSTGVRTNYRWDLDRVVPAGDGISGNTRFMAVSYLQDQVTTSGHITIRDAAIQQIIYGTATSGAGLAGTVDFLYKGVTAKSSGGIQWVTAYGTNEGSTCKPPNNLSTTLRCDDPLDYGTTMLKPAVMSTFSLQAIKTYVGSDTSTPLHPDYSYTLSNSEGSFHYCLNDLTGAPQYCAGEHVLNGITPAVYQNGTAYTLPGITFSYAGLSNKYVDTTQKVNGNAYSGNDYWYYLNEYHDHSNGSGEKIVYETAYNNTHGTPAQSNGENRNDANYCAVYTDCTGIFVNPEDKAWTEQVVHTITAIGTDSSSSSLQPATTTYHYGLADVGSGCPADSQGFTNCVGYMWSPKGDNDWQDDYHAEFHGFMWVYITSPANNLTALNYSSTEGMGTSAEFSGNYTSGQLYEVDTYSGPNSVASNLLSVTRNTYAGNIHGTPFACITTTGSTTYLPCEIMLAQSKTTTYEQNTTLTPPWIENDYTYDDYTISQGLGNYAQAPATGAYHNLQQQVTTSSNAPTVTKKWTYDTTDATVNGTVYYDVNKIAHSELDDANGHVWACQDLSYDEGIGSSIPRPAAGWLTTRKAYANCADQSNTAINEVTGYDTYGNPVATVDGVASANSGAYSNNGCTLPTAPAAIGIGWTANHYTTCTSHDPQSGQITSQTNAFGQTTTLAYDPGQGQIAQSTTDANGQTTSTAYSYNANGDPTTSVTQPGEINGYTSQTQEIAQCSNSSTLPCLEEDSNSSTYAGAIARTFYDLQGRAIEMQAPLADGSQTEVNFTTYDDVNHTVFTSQPFAVATRSSWLDPSTAPNTPGSLAYLDASGRTIKTVDALGNTVQTIYGLGTISGDSNIYRTSTAIDANGHVTITTTDALGRTTYEEYYSGTYGGTLTPNELKTFQYNAIDKPISVTVTDQAPQSGQTTTTVTTTTQYDDLGRVTSVNDPDRSPSTYTYDADGRIIATISGIQTVGTSYDLLGRVGCVQDTVPTFDPKGACSNGANPYVQNTYDADPSGVSWGSKNYAVGALTQSISTTYLPGPDYTQGYVTENMQYDQRGRLSTENLNVSTSGGGLSFPTLPQYQQTHSYNDANQLMTTQTTVGGQTGYTFSQAYNNTTGMLNGLSNNSVGVANLATLSYTAQNQVSDINLLSSTGGALADNNFQYDGDLRLAGTTATWQGDSGQSGTIYQDGVSYDAVGNVLSRVSIQATVPGQSSSGGSDTQNFCYDEQNRLVWAGNSGTVPAAGNGTCGSATFQSTLGNAYSDSFVYTHLGQLWQGPLNGSGTQEQYLYCNSSQPHQVTALAPLSSAPTCSNAGQPDVNLTYDAWGNVDSRTSAGTTGTFSYDGLNELVRWNSSNKNQAEWNLYDSKGERILRRTYDGSNTTITVYAFGLEEHQYSYSGSGNSATNTGNTYYYTLGGQLLGTLSGTNTLSTTFMLTDTLGSVVSSISTTSGAATIQGNQEYGPYGNLRYSKGTMGTDKGYTGQYNDNLTGLDYYGARYYDPVIGRFLAADTVQGNQQGSDPYAYVGGNPETDTDPTGHMVYDAGTGQAAIREPNGNISVFGYNMGTNGTFDTSVSTGIWHSGGSYSWSTYTPAVYVYHPPIHRATPRPAPRRVVHRQASNSLGDNLKSWGLGLLDLTTGIPSMINDVHTIFGTNAPLYDKIGAGLDFGFNATSDVLMVTGVGELMRGAAIGEHVGANLIEHIGEDAVASCGVGLSFIATTVVATRLGEQAIGTLHPGQQVWAYNPTTKKMELQPIVHVWINHDHDLIDLTITHTIKQRKANKPVSEVLHTNKRHPFLTVEKGFLPVGQIKLGMHILEANGQTGVVSGWKVVPGVMTMYNLEVALDHTFAVGVGMWVVHNCGNTGLPDPANKVAGQNDLYRGQQVDSDQLLKNGWTTSERRGGRNDAGKYISDNFKKLLGDNGKNPNDWTYQMQTWVKGNAKVDNHYWYSSTDPDFGAFHHH